MAAMFTARHYAALAKVINDADRYDDGELIGPGLVADIAAMLAKDNPLFDRAKFEEAAGTANKAASHQSYCAAVRHVGGTCDCEGFGEYSRAE